jgi:hypothetical protein
MFVPCYLHLQGQSMRFLSKVILPKVPTCTLIWNLKQFWCSFEFAEIFNFLGPFTLWATTVNLVMRYGPQATAANLVMRYGPLYAMKPYSNNRGPYCRIWLCTLGHAQYFVMCHGSQDRISLCTMGRSAGFGYGLCDIAQTNYHSAGTT